MRLEFRTEEGAILCVPADARDSRVVYNRLKHLDNLRFFRFRRHQFTRSGFPFAENLHDRIDQDLRFVLSVLRVGFDAESA